MNLRLPDHYLGGYFGFSGSTSSPLVDSTQMQVCEEWKPHKVFIQVTGKLFLHFSQLWMWCKGFGELMTDFHSVDSVIIGSLFHRTRPRGMTTQDNNVQVDRVNMFLKKFYEPNTRVQFWTIRGLVKPSWNIWIDDGTHLNNSVTRNMLNRLGWPLGIKIID